MNRFKLIGVACALGVLTAVSFGQDPMTAPVSNSDAASFKRVLKVGDTMKFKLKADLEFSGQQVGFTSNVQEKVTDVGADGGYKIESSQSDSKINMNGQEQDVPDQAHSNTTSYNAAGEILEITGDNVESGAYRMATLGVLKAPDAPAKIGDAWTYKIAANSKTGVVNSTADYKYLANEKIGDRDTVKVSVKVHENEGSDPASNEGTVWLDVKDFSMVKSDTTWANAPIPGAPGPINGKVVLTRV